LSDVASCDEQEESCKLLLETRLPFVLKAGEKIDLSKSKIETSLTDLELSSPLAFVGPEQVEIRVAVLEISQGHLISYLEGLIKNFVVDRSDLQLRISGLRIMGDARIIPGEIS